MMKKLAFVPLFILMAIAYVFPILSNVINSFKNDNGEYVGLKNYTDVLSSYYFLDSLWFTLKIAFIATAVAMCIAIVAALALRETFVGKKIVLFLFQYNLCVPHIVVAMMMVMLLSQTGIISSICYTLGITKQAEDFIFLIRDSKGIGIIITFIWKYFPYIGLSVLGVLQSASLEYERQAAVLGVGKWKRFIYVILPQIIPTTSMATIVVFAAAFGEYEIPAILSSASHRTLSIMIYMKYCDLSTQNVPHAYAMMIMQTLILMIIILSFYWLTNRGRSKRV